MKHIDITLSLICIINGARPRAIQGRTIIGSIFRLFLRIFKIVLFPKRNESTQIQAIACEMTVATAAPFTPISKTNMRIGSRTMFTTAPMRTDIILVLVAPCADM